jgi:hypothetical protein
MYVWINGINVYSADSRTQWYNYWLLALEQNGVMCTLLTAELFGRFCVISFHCYCCHISYIRTLCVTVSWDNFGEVTRRISDTFCKGPTVPKILRSDRKDGGQDNVWRWTAISNFRALNKISSISYPPQIFLLVFIENGIYDVVGKLVSWFRSWP